jgi:hypothetical protein
MSEELPPPVGEPVQDGAPMSRTPKIIFWAFVVSLFGIFILPAIAAIIMAAVAWRKTKEVGKGKGLAISAILISIFWLGLVTFAVINSPSDGNDSSTHSEVVEEEISIENETQASESAEEEAVPDNNLADESVGYKLSVIDGEFDQSSVSLYEKRIAQVSERCNESEGDVGGKVVKATELLDERGITESNLWVMDSVLQAIPPSESGTLNCSEVITLLVTLRINE